MQPEARASARGLECSSTKTQAPEPTFLATFPALVSFPVFPVFGAERLCGCGSSTCHSPGKHPPYSFLSDTSSPVPLGANAGIKTGTRLPDGRFLCVIDLDLRPPSEKLPHGKNGMGPFLARYGASLPPDVVIVATPSGGAHVYFSTSQPVKGRADVLGIVGCDVRGANGYVLAPGSVGFVDKETRTEVAPYRWIAGSRIAPMPPQMEAELFGARALGPLGAALATGGGLPDLSSGVPTEERAIAVEWAATESTEEGISALSKACRAIAEARDGTKNDTLFRQCVKLGDLGMMGLLTIDDARRAVYNTVQAWSDPEKTIATIERAFARAKAQKIVVVAPDHMRMNDEAIGALSAHPAVYAIGDKLAIESSAAPKADATDVRIKPMTVAGLRELLSRVVSYRRRDAKTGEYAPVHVPDFTPPEILSRGHWEGVRVVEGYSVVPVLRPDGSVVREAGYDDATKLYMAHSWEESLPKPKDALALLRYLVKDFPFAQGGDLTAWLSACCTPLAMYMFQGPSPLHLFEASRKNSGKSFLASAATIIGSGRPATQEAAWPQGNEGELAKKLLSWALELDKPVVFYDNVDGEFSSATLAGFLTSQDRRVSDRMLGANATFTGKLNTVFMVSANNPIIGTDLERRIVPCRLEPTEDVYANRDFELKDFLGWVRTHRRTLTLCAISLLLEGHRLIREGVRPAGRPAHSFEGWARAVRDPLMALGLPDPWTGTERLGQEEEELGRDAAVSLASTLATRAPLAGEGREYGWSSNDLLGLLDPHAPPTIFKAFALRKFPRGHVSSKTLGYFLRTMAGVWVDHPTLGKVKIMCTTKREGRDRSRVWCLRRTDGTVIVPPTPSANAVAGL